MSNASPASCVGDPGAFDSQGIPAGLPSHIQLGGVAYLFVRSEAPDAVGLLTRLVCIGPFELASTDLVDQAEVVYLRSTGSGVASSRVYRFEAAATYQIQFQVTDRPQVITTGDQTYRLEQVWQSSVYSSTSVVLYVADPANPSPAVVYGLDVSQTVVGDAIGEYRLTAATAPPPEGTTAAAEQVGLNTNLTLNGQDYVLVNVYTPTGTTRNGFVTLFGTNADGTSDVLFGRDPRGPELFIFVLDTTLG